MRNAMNRNLPGTRLQGARHGKPRTTVPVNPRALPPKMYGEYPVETIYAGRNSASIAARREELQKLYFLLSAIKEKLELGLDNQGPIR